MPNTKKFLLGFVKKVFCEKTEVAKQLLKTQNYYIFTQYADFFT